MWTLRTKFGLTDSEGAGRTKRKERDILLHPALRVDMNAALTMKEVEARFDGEWVLIDEPVTNESLEIKRGIVRFHSADQSEVYTKAAELGLKRSAVVFVGRMPQKMEYVL